MPIINSKKNNNDFRKMNFGTINPFIMFIMIMQKKKHIIKLLLCIIIFSTYLRVKYFCLLVF